MTCFITLFKQEKIKLNECHCGIRSTPGVNFVVIGILSYLKVNLRDWAVSQAGASCYYWAALSEDFSKSGIFYGCCSYKPYSLHTNLGLWREEPALARLVDHGGLHEVHAAGAGAGAAGLAGLVGQVVVRVAPPAHAHAAARGAARGRVHLHVDGAGPPERLVLLSQLKLVTKKIESFCSI